MLLHCVYATKSPFSIHKFSYLWMISCLAVSTFQFKSNQKHLFASFFHLRFDSPALKSLFGRFIRWICMAAFLHVFLRCLRFRSTTYHKLFIAHSCREQQQKSTHTHTILLWQTVQNINRIFSLCFGQLMTFTAVYIADSIGIDNILVSFFRRMTMNWTAYYVSPFSILREIKPNTN